LEGTVGITLDDATQAVQAWQDIDSDTVLISVDEYFLGFQGSVFELLSTMEGEDT
jgi:hypothetical protein